MKRLGAAEVFKGNRGERIPHVADGENMPSRIPVVEKFTGSALRIERYLGRYRLAAFRMNMRMSQRKSSQRWLKRR